MQKLFTAALAAAFASASTLAMLAFGAQQPAVAHSQFLSAASTIAYADDENENGDRDNDEHGNNGNQSDNCVNPAGHVKGWCKHHGDDDNDRDHHGKHKHHGHGNVTISGTVLSVSGNLATVRLDNGQIITVNENGTALNVGQHYTLNGCYSNNQFVLNCNNNNDRGNGANASVHGTIFSIGNGTVTLLGVPPVTINVQQAINNNATNGALTIGRSITAYGYYSNNVFYATSIQ